MELTERQLNYLIQRLEESDKALSGRVPRDAVLAAQTDIFLRLGIKDRERMSQGLSEMGNALASFREDMVGLVSKFQAGQLTSTEALADWKALTGKYYVDMFKAGAKSVGNPYFDELTSKDMAFINKARRFESQFFKGFLDDMNDPNFHATHPFLDRAEYYADSAKAQFYNGMVAGAGKEVEIDWVLGIAEHCEDCEMLYSGSPYTWDTLPTTPQAGDTECLFNCKCHLEIRAARGAEEGGMEVGTPVGAGPESTKPSEMPGHYATVWDANGNAMTGEILDAAEDLYSEMYKARQMVSVTDGTEQEDWIHRRQALNRELVQRFEDMGYRVTPNVAVKDLIDVARDAIAEAPEGVIRDTTQIMLGAEVIFVRANYAARGVVAMHGAAVYVEMADGSEYRYDHNTDILFLLHNPTQNESLEEGSATSGNFYHAGRPTLVGGSGPGGSGELDPNEVRDYRTLPQYEMSFIDSDETRIIGARTATVVDMDRDLLDNEVTTIMDYTAIGNGAVNRELKGYDITDLHRDPQEVSNMINHMDEGMKISRTNEDLTLFRGVSFAKARQLELIAEQKGTFTDKGFVSTSTQKDITRDFGIQIKILVPKGFPAINVPKIVGIRRAWENEIILNRNVTFKVDKIRVAVPGIPTTEQLIILRPVNRGNHG